MESSSHALHSLFAGGVGGATATVFSGYPLDTVKVRLQSQPLTRSGQPLLYKGMFDCLKKTLQQEGFIGLYRGMTITLMTSTPVNATYFYGYNIGLRYFAIEQESHGPRMIDTIKAASFAGALSGLVVAPGDRIKCLLQVQNDASRRPLKMMRIVYKKKGIVGIFRGVSGAVSREVFACTGYFVGLEAARDLVLHLAHESRPEDSRVKLTAFQTVLVGICGGSIACAVALPFDVVKSRQQSSPVDSQPKSVLCIFQELWNQEGLKGLYRGGTLAMVRLVPTSGMCFFVYDNVMKVLDRNLSFF